MKAIIDTSAISWLDITQDLGLLSKVYEKIYIPPAVKDELEPHLLHHKNVEIFIKEKLYQFENKEEKEFFKTKVDDYLTKYRISCRQRGDIEVYILNKYFTKFEEIVFANQKAQNRFKRDAKVRDIAQIPEIGLKQNVMTKQEALKYLEKLLYLNYRPFYVKNSIKNLNLYFS